MRVWGDTAVVTALLWIKGTQGSQSFERKLWFSDTYVRTAKGWRLRSMHGRVTSMDETVGSTFVRSRVRRTRR